MLTEELAEFTAEEYEHRLANLRNEMEAAGLDAVLINTDTNHRYFTGHWTHRWMHKFTSMFAILPMNKDPVLVVPPLETGMCELDCWVEDIRTYPPPIRVQAGDNVQVDPLQTFHQGRVFPTIQIGTGFHQMNQIHR